MCIMSCMPMTGLFCNLFYCYSVSLNSSLPTPQSGQAQSAGRSSNAVPGAIPLSGSPTAGSYTYPQTSQTYFFIIALRLFRSRSLFSCCLGVFSLSRSSLLSLLGSLSSSDFCFLLCHQLSLCRVLCFLFLQAFAVSLLLVV